jgi:hypothetical protein
MIHKYLLCLILLFLTNYDCKAQVCYFKKIELMPKKIVSSVKQSEIEACVKNIMNVFGGFSKKFSTVTCTDNNAYAYIKTSAEKNERVIYYDLQFLSNVVNECHYSVAYIPIIAHEIGHHLAGHTEVEIGNRKYAELDADLFAGFVCRRLGLTDSQTTAPFYLLADNEATDNYPSKQGRINKVREGWQKAGVGIFNIDMLSQEKLDCDYKISIKNGAGVYLRNQPMTQEDYTALNNRMTPQHGDSINNKSIIISVFNNTPIKIIRSIGQCYEIKFKQKDVMYQGYIAKKIFGRSTVATTHYKIDRILIFSTIGLIAIMALSLIYLFIKNRQLKKIT